MNNSLGKEAQEFEDQKRAYYQKLADEKKQGQKKKKRLKREREQKRSQYEQEQKEIQQKLQLEKEERESFARIRRLEALLFKHFYKKRKAENVKLKIESDLKQLKEEYPEFFNFGLRTVFGYAFMLTFFVAVLIINFLLTRASAEYLVSQAFPPGSFAVNLGAILFPLVLLLFELGICSQLFAAKMSPFSPNVQLWQALANMIVFVTPALLLGTNVALYAGDDWPPELYDLILLAAMAILAYVSDACIVYGYDFYQEGVAFFWFRINHLLREKKLEDSEDMFFEQQFQLNRLSRDYQEAISDHHSMFKSKIEPVQINMSSSEQFSLKESDD